MLFLLKTHTHTQFAGIIALLFLNLFNGKKRLDSDNVLCVGLSWLNPLVFLHLLYSLLARMKRTHVQMALCF